jgi:hypothetical protein
VEVFHPVVFVEVFPEVYMEDYMEDLFHHPEVLFRLLEVRILEKGLQLELGFHHPVHLLMVVELVYFPEDLELVHLLMAVIPAWVLDLEELLLMEDLL